MPPKSSTVNFDGELVTALIAAYIKATGKSAVDYKYMSGLLNKNGSGPTASALEHKFRPIRKDAIAMVDAEPGTPAEPSTPRKKGKKSH